MHFRLIIKIAKMRIFLVIYRGVFCLYIILEDFDILDEIAACFSLKKIYRFHSKLPFFKLAKMRTKIAVPKRKCRKMFPKEKVTQIFLAHFPDIITFLTVLTFLASF